MVGLLVTLAVAAVAVVLIAASGDTCKVPSADRRAVVDGRVEIAHSSTTNPAGAEEFEMSYLLLPAIGVSVDSIAVEMSRLEGKGWKVAEATGEGASVLSPTGKTLARIEYPETFLRECG
ncbi:hypothetical protein [Kitasatospora sp. NPDC059327]|uniref:hypothetical protein n=1 Tax=Kitasatospora sp. NPDC059327 TaxID=3346803 RepID=UPI0036C60C8E